MILSEGNKARLAEEGNSQTKNRPLFYLKFVKEERFAQDVCNGRLYANTAEYFRQQEIESGERGQGDRFETLLNLNMSNINLVNKQTGQVVMSFPGVMSLKFDVDSLIPIVCFVGIPIEQMKIIEDDETHTSCMLPFTDEEYDSMETKFGKYCAIISADELEKNVSNYCLENGCDYLLDEVIYCEPNRVDRVEAFSRGTKERFLYKNEDLAYQREYRLAIGMKIPDDHFITIGALKHSNYLESRSLKELCFTVNYKTSENP